MQGQAPAGQFDDLRCRYPLDVRCVRVGNDHIKLHRKMGILDPGDAYAAHFQQSCNGRWRSCHQNTVNILKQNLIVTDKMSTNGFC